MNQIEKKFAEAKIWFDRISEASGLKKLPVIKECKTNSPDAWNLLITYLNPYYVFHIGEKSMEADIQEQVQPFDSCDDMLHHLIYNISSASNKDIARVKETIGLIENETVRLFAKRYITKTLKIGATATTINAAVGTRAIPTFGCMLANKYFEHPDAVVGKQIAITEKLDGIRALAIVESHFQRLDQGKPVWTCKVEFFSRQGQRITGLVEIQEAIKKQLTYLYQLGVFTGTFVLDGELLITDRENIPSKDQYKLTTKIVRADTNTHKTGVTYNVFDIISKIDFASGQSSATYSDRRKALEILFKNCSSKAIQIVPILSTILCNDSQTLMEHVTEHVAKARQEGKEGVMINVCDAPYVCKRTNNLLKVKVFNDCDLKIIGYQPGSGKYEGTLGALLVDYKGTEVGVGTGLTDLQRKEFWDNQEKYLGRVVTVQYFEETNDKTGKKSIRFPVFKELREIGKEVSY